MRSELKKIRCKLGISQMELCVHAGIGMGLIVRMEKGQPVRLDSLCRVALALGVAVADLYPELMVRPKRRTISPKDNSLHRNRDQGLDHNKGNNKSAARMSRDAAQTVTDSYRSSGEPEDRGARR